MKPSASGPLPLVVALGSVISRLLVPASEAGGMTLQVSSVFMLAEGLQLVLRSIISVPLVVFAEAGVPMVVLVLEAGGRAFLTASLVWPSCWLDVYWS